MLLMLILLIIAAMGRPRSTKNRARFAFWLHSRSVHGGGKRPLPVFKRVTLKSRAPVFFARIYGKNVMGFLSNTRC